MIRILLPESAMRPPQAPPLNPAFYPFADKVDTLTDATLIYTFL